MAGRRQCRPLPLSARPHDAGTWSGIPSPRPVDPRPAVTSSEPSCAGCPSSAVPAGAARRRARDGTVLDAPGDRGAAATRSRCAARRRRAESGRPRPTGPTVAERVVAGSDVVIPARPCSTKGYAGARPGQRRGDLERPRQAIAVWIYADRARRPVLPRRPATASSGPRHQPATAPSSGGVGLPGIGFVLVADQPGPGRRRRDPADRFDAAAGPRRRCRRCSGLTDRRPDPAGRHRPGRVRAGGAARTGRPGSRPAGGRVLYVTATPRDGGCYVTRSGRDDASGRCVWWQDRLSTCDTARGAGCEQRKDPVGGGNAAGGAGRDGRPDAARRRRRPRGAGSAAAGEKVLATDGVLRRGPQRRRHAQIIDVPARPAGGLDRGAGPATRRRPPVTAQRRDHRRSRPGPHHRCSTDRRPRVKPRSRQQAEVVGVGEPGSAAWQRPARTSATCRVRMTSGH